MIRTAGKNIIIASNIIQVTEYHCDLHVMYSHG